MPGRTKRPQRPSDSPNVHASTNPGDAPPLDAEFKLANRVAILTFLTAFAIVATLVALPRALEGGGTFQRVLASLVPLVGAALLLALLRARAALRAARQRRTTDAPAATGR